MALCMLINGHDGLLMIIADNETVRLEEDITLAGFTPLFCNVPMEIYCHRDIDKDMAQVSGRS